MITAKFNSSQFERDMKNLVGYSIGFLDGVKAGKPTFFKNVGNLTVDSLKQFIDSNARVNPEVLHHVYEWYQTGSPAARLFDIEYTVKGAGISINSTFRQSSSVKDGSSTPFYDKAKIMEQGIPVTIKPKTSKVLVFNDESGEPVFTKNKVTVLNPGGDVSGEYSRVFDLFMNSYFRQSFLADSRLGSYLKNPTAFKKNLAVGKKSGRPRGRSVGYQWIVGAGDSL